MKPLSRHLINHITILLDASASMRHLSGQLVAAVNAQVAALAKRSVEMSQETRVSIYTFADNPKNVVFDMDVMRLPDISKIYLADGWTALMDAVNLGILDAQKLPELYGDHAFLLYLFTDGIENHSRQVTSGDLRAQLASLLNNWTVVAQVPGAEAFFELKKLGFDARNIERWDATPKGLEEASERFSRGVERYMNARSSGLRRVDSFYTDLTGVKAATVKKAADTLSPKKYDLYHVWAGGEGEQIRNFIEAVTGESYRIGSAYYEPVKAVTVQSYKNVVLLNRRDGKAYIGDGTRELLGLPDHSVTIRPGNHADWRVFIQSTSTNRKLHRGTQVLVMK